MKRNLKCGVCGTKTNSATGGRLQLTGEGAYMLTLNPVGECWDCGEKRREQEEQRKQDRLSRLFGE